MKLQTQLGEDRAGSLPTRRSVLRSGLFAGLAFMAAGRGGAATLSGPKRSAAGVSQGTAEVARVVKTDDEWRKQLSRSAYQVTRHEDTERAFSGEYADNHSD